MGGTQSLTHASLWVGDGEVPIVYWDVAAVVVLCLILWVDTPNISLESTVFPRFFGFFFFFFTSFTIFFYYLYYSIRHFLIATFNLTYRPRKHVGTIESRAIKHKLVSLFVC